MRHEPHFSVMTEEVIAILLPSENSVYVDATFGAGGHTRKILEVSNASNVIGIDRDPNVTAFADKIKQQFHDRFQFVNAKFSEIKSVIGSKAISGILFDVGVSSMQINNPERGFSFMRDGPLTMTMGRNDISAYDVVNKYREDHIAEILWKYGDERAATIIAKSICTHRRITPISTTLQLAEIVKSVVPKRGKIHPATLTFQAIRVYVNEELKELEVGLKSAIESISIGGKVVVITFQGLEDKIVKDVFKIHTQKTHSNKFKQKNTDKSVFINLTKNVLKPSRKEIKKNIRARSAKIRAIVRVA